MLRVPPDDEENRPGHKGLGVASAAVSLVAVGLVFALQTEPRLPAFEWTSVEGPPPPVNLDSVTEFPSGIAVLSGITPDGVFLWWSEDGVDWARQNLAWAPSQLAAIGSDLVVYRVRSGQLLEMEDDRWVPRTDFDFPAETRSRQASGRPSVIGTEAWLLELSLFGDLWWSGDGTSFSLVLSDPTWGPGVERPFDSACEPPFRSSPDVPPVVLTGSGLVALVSSNPAEPFGVWPVCEPVVWTSTNGATWHETSTAIGGEGSFVYDIAERGGDLIAVGGSAMGAPAVWIAHDVESWTQIDPTDLGSVDLYSVEGGDAGWVILGRDPTTSAPVGWTSVDGTCWERIPQIAMGTDVVVTSGSVILVDRSRFPVMWRGEPTGSGGACS